MRADSANRPGGIYYRIDWNGRPIVKPSWLGLSTHPANPNMGWQQEFAIRGTERTSFKQSWKPPFGEREAYEDHYNQLTLTLTTAKQAGEMLLIARVYDQGVAFRYAFPERLETQILEIHEELTTFCLPTESIAWFTPSAQARYESKPIRNWVQAAELPVTAELPGGTWVSLAEADAANYARTRLQTTSTPGELKTALFGEVVETSPFATPWRVVLIGQRPGDLLQNNYLLLNLNSPSVIANTDWIKPGLVMRESKLSTPNAKALVDFAVEQEIDYIHFDAGWYGYEYDAASDATRVDVDPRRNPKKDLDLAKAIRYARSKGKQVILYVNHRALERHLDTLLPLYKRWGVSGVKFGFVHVGSHRWTVWLHEAVRKAAQHGLMVDIHDEYRPSGFSRTYPNLMTQEGILGNEGFPDATYNTILPFTRFIAGAADYTFCFNVESLRPSRVKTTKAHQLALPVLYYSPWQFLYWYGSPEHYPNRQEISFWKGLPTTWQETRVVAGTPGESVTIARRRKQTWYVGCITNTQARTISLPLTFLTPGKTYLATLHEDTADGQVRQRQQNVSTKTTLTLPLRASGGAAIRIDEL